jgi:hypothetical protein
MRSLIGGIAVMAALMVLGHPTPAGASEQSAVWATVHQFIDSFNKGDEKTGEAACASQAYIMDEFAPHQWIGADACTVWAHAYDANAAANGITDGFVALGTPWIVDVTGDRGYIVAPATYTYKQHGKPVTESGSVFTVVLKKAAAGWRITGWTWSKHTVR